MRRELSSGKGSAPLVQNRLGFAWHYNNCCLLNFASCSFKKQMTGSSIQPTQSAPKACSATKMTPINKRSSSLCYHA
eukprot:1158122-Pelagomonas_calceolata.AAC.2